MYVVEIPPFFAPDEHMHRYITKLLIMKQLTIYSMYDIPRPMKPLIDHEQQYMRSNVPKTYQEATINHLDTQSAKPENPSRKTTSPYWISMPAYPPTQEPEPRQLADRKPQALLPAAEQTIPASTKAPSTCSPQSNDFVPSVRPTFIFLVPLSNQLIE